MRQSIRALGWTITIFMVILSAFLATALYSVFQLAMVEQGIRFGEFQLNFHDNTLVLSVPVTVNNTGYYDITDFNVTTTLRGPNGVTLTRGSTSIEKIKRGSARSKLHNLSLELADILLDSYLLFNDAELRIDFHIGFRYAYALGFRLAVTNVSMPWGAPLHGLALKEASLSSFNGTHLRVQIFLELENHSIFNIDGNLHLEVYNEAGEHIGSGKGTVSIPSYSRLDRPIEAMVKVENPLNYTGKGYVMVRFELPMVDYTIEFGSFPYG